MRLNLVYIQLQPQGSNEITVQMEVITMTAQFDPAPRDAPPGPFRTPSSGAHGARFVFNLDGAQVETGP
jgi:hypothetical protein